MNQQIIGIKQLHQNLKKIAEAALAGQSFIVVKNSRPVFKIEPIQSVSKKYTLADFRKLQFKIRDRNLSRKIDKILY
jgi:antitoxin (DNA-binding transcriptional repressor) of toxin-antitoxin stability system